MPPATAQQRPGAQRPRAALLRHGSSRRPPLPCGGPRRLYCPQRARSSTPSSSPSLGGSGVFCSSARPITASTIAGSASPLDAVVGEPAGLGAAGEPLDRLGRGSPALLRAERDAELLDLLACAQLHDPHEVRQHDRVRLGVRGAAHPHDRLADGVMHREAGEPARVARQERAQRQRRAGRPPPRQARPRSARRRAAPPSWRPGSSAACRAPRPRARARSWRSPRGRASAGMPSGPARPAPARDASAGTRRHPRACGGRRSSRRPTASSGSPRSAGRRRRRSPWPRRSRGRRRAPPAACR